MLSVLQTLCVQFGRINARMCRLSPVLSLENIQQTRFNDHPFPPLTCLVCAIDHLLPHRRRSSLCCSSATAPALPSRCNLLLNSDFFAFSSLTRLARIDAYSFCQLRISYVSPKTTSAHVDAEKRRQDIPQHPWRIRPGDA